MCNQPLSQHLFSYGRLYFAYYFPPNQQQEEKKPPAFLCLADSVRIPGLITSLDSLNSLAHHSASSSSARNANVSVRFTVGMPLNNNKRKSCFRHPPTPYSPVVRPSDTLPLPLPPCSLRWRCSTTRFGQLSTVPSFSKRPVLVKRMDGGRRVCQLTDGNLNAERVLQHNHAVNAGMIFSFGVPSSLIWPRPHQIVPPDVHSGDLAHASSGSCVATPPSWDRCQRNTAIAVSDPVRYHIDRLPPLSRPPRPGQKTMASAQ